MILDIPVEHRDMRVVFTFSEGSAFSVLITDLLQSLQNGPLDFCHEFDTDPPMELISVLLARPEDVLATIIKYVSTGSCDDQDHLYTIGDVVAEFADDGSSLTCEFSTGYCSVATIPVLPTPPRDDDEDISKWRKTLGDLYVFDAGILRKETLAGLSVDEWRRKRNPNDPRCPLAGIDIGAWSTYGKNPGTLIAAMSIR